MVDPMEEEPTTEESMPTDHEHRIDIWNESERNSLTPVLNLES